MIINTVSIPACILKFYIHAWHYTHTDTQYCPVLYLHWLEMDYTADISANYWILDDDANTVLLSTIILQLGPLLLTWFNSIPACISNYIHYEVWDAIIYPFLNFKGCTVDV